MTTPIEVGFHSAPTPAKAAASARSRRRPARIQASYDAAQTTPENAKHWAWADALSARYSNTLDVRKKLRERARYEVSNNSYAKGIILTLANDLVGPGPTLRVMTPDPVLNKAIETRFAEWSAAVRLADTLRTLKQSKTVDGEGFVVFASNPLLPNSVQLDLKLIECDQVTTPDLSNWARYDAVDGITFDQWGNPEAYDVLRVHPGDNLAGWGQYDRLPARRVLHWYRCDRPGQARGVSELTPALPLFAQLRRFTLATLSAAEVAANFAAIIKTTVGPDTDAAPGGSMPGGESAADFPSFQMDRGMITAVPEGWDAMQMKAEHPATTYEMFVRMILREIARCLSMPFNLAAGDSASYNYSSARLDHLIYRSAVAVERDDCEAEILDRILCEWMEEASRIPLYLPESALAFLHSLPHKWVWPAWAYIDPLTEAQADTERLTNGTETLADICAERGGNWRDKIRQRVTEKAFEAQVMREMGVAGDGSQPQTMPSQTPPNAQASAPVAIQAAARPSKIRIAAVAPIQIQAAAADAPRLRRFEMLAYTGGAMQLPGYNLPLVVDLAGLSIPSQKRPILRDHKPWKAVAHSEEIHNDGQQLLVAGVVSGVGPDARELLQLHDNGFPWQSSIGAAPLEVETIHSGQTVTVNGQTFTGPLYIARRSELREISFVPNGADGRTTASIAASGGFAMTFEQWCLGFMTIEEFTALGDDAKKALQKAYDAQQTEEDSEDGTAVDGSMPPPAAATATPPPVTATAAPPTIQASATDTIAARRREEAAELRRVNTIRRLSAAHPGILIQASGRQLDYFEHAIEQGLDARDVELHVLRHTRNSPGPHLHVAGSAPAPTNAVIEAAFAIGRGMPNIEKHYKAQDLEMAHQHFRNFGLQQALIMAAAQNGMPVPPGMRVTRGNLRTVLQHAYAPIQASSGMSSMSIAGILSNVANKEILIGFMEEDDTWREISQVKSVSDFKTVTSYRLLDSMEYEELGPAGEIKHGKIDSESYTRQAKTYAKMFALTRETIINDDLGALDDLQSRLGRGSKKKFNNLFWTKFLDNSAFFTSGRGNYITGSTTNLAADGVGLGLGVKAFRMLKSSSADGAKRVGGRPTVLLVPPELEAIAETLYQSTNLASVKAADANIYVNKYRPVIVPWLSDSDFTGYSATAWYLFRNPNEYAPMVVSFLNGQQAPTVEAADADFDQLGIQFRGYHDFGADQAEWLAGVKSKGAA